MDSWDELTRIVGVRPKASSQQVREDPTLLIHGYEVAEIKPLAERNAEKVRLNSVAVCAAKWAKPTERRLLAGISWPSFIRHALTPAGADASVSVDSGGAGCRFPQRHPNRRR